MIFKELKFILQDEIFKSEYQRFGSRLVCYVSKCQLSLYNMLWWKPDKMICLKRDDIWLTHTYQHFIDYWIFASIDYQRVKP